MCVHAFIVVEFSWKIIISTIEKRLYYFILFFVEIVLISETKSDMSESNRVKIISGIIFIYPLLFCLGRASSPWNWSHIVRFW